MSANESVQTYVARQKTRAVRWRRSIFRAIIRNIPFHWVKLTINNIENVPDDGPLIVMINHISALDPGLMMGVVTNRFVIPMTKIENTSFFLGKLVVWWWDAYTVRRGEIDRQALTNSIELLKSGQCLLIAPEGTRNPEGLQRPKEGMAYIATKADATIIPAAISGAVGWKEKWLRLQRPHLKVTFGKPFKFKTEGRRVPRDNLNVMTDEAMYQLATALPDPALRGVYTDLSKATVRFLEFIGTEDEKKEMLI